MSTEEKTIRTVITPNDQFLRQVFSVSKAYYIDIYQREYKWTRENVETLLKDIEVHFEQHARTKTDPRDIQAEVQGHYEPYFLNTYLTHSTATNISIVDGQQRLTTFLLILIKLCQILKLVESDKTYSDRTFSSQTLEKLIFESDDFGDATRFKIFNENREGTFRKLVESKSIEPKDETQKRIKENMDAISEYYDQFLASEKDNKRYDLKKLTYYISYLLDRISIVEIKIEKQQNVAMIFEVVNDRGLGLKPYEIIKGKLIGNLPAEQKEHANSIWTKLQDNYFNAILKNSTEAKLDLDMFFRTFFRAKFADSENVYDKFEGDYHYVMYRDPKIRAYFQDFADRNLLYRRITEDIKYFAELYLWLRTTYDNEYLIFNKLLDQNLQYLLILSHITVNDPERDQKITEIARKFERFHAILRLLDVYESNAFQRMIFPINRDIRDCAISEAKGVFDRELIKNLAEAEIVQKGEVNTIADLFTYEKFKGVRNRWTNFSKYILMRIDKFLAQQLDKPSYASGPLEELEEHFNKTTRRKYGMHLEHIYAFNNSNKELFTDGNGIFDEQAFNNTRNLLGMVLLLKDRQNESSSNEKYQKKFERYKKSNFIWNELMVGHLDVVDLRNIPAEWFLECINPDYNGAFPRSKVESRQRSIFAAIKTIWLDETDRAL
jgi:uncharacterized protein with ParB-like and HNH nuclease domain